MITAMRLLSGYPASTARFWAAVFNVEPVDIGPDRHGRELWRVTSASGLTVQIEPAPTWQHITTVEMTVTCDMGAPDRLRERGFEVSAPGFPLSAVDVNGTDSTVRLLTFVWDGVSEFYEDDPDDEEKERIRRLLDMAPPDEVTGEVRVIKTSAPATLGRFLAAWFAVTPTEIPSSGVVRVVAGDTLFRIERVGAPERQWVPLGSRDFAAAVERCAAAGFTITPSPTHPETAGHYDLGDVTFLLTEVQL